MKRALVLVFAVTQACGPNAPATRREDPTRATARSADAPRYDATLRDGVQFWKPGLPLFVADLTGVSLHETWGRWTVGPVAVLTFADPLPSRFTLVVTAATNAPNVGHPMSFIAGAATETATFETVLGQGPPDVRRLRFETPQRADRIEIRPRYPTRPDNGDDRQLGLALIRLQIEPD